MRIAPFWLLLSLLFTSPITALADDSAPKREIPDGMTVTATGQAGDFSQHWLAVMLSTPDKEAKAKVTAILDSLGLKGGGAENNNPFMVSLPLPEGKCDGQRVGAVSRVKLLEALEATGMVRSVLLRSYASSSASVKESVQKQALTAAMKAAREKAQAIAREGGGQLGALLGMEYEVETNDETRVMALTRQGVQLQEHGGDKIRVEARYALKK